MKKTKPSKKTSTAMTSPQQDILPQDIGVIMKSLIANSEKDRDLVEAIVLSGVSLSQEKVIESIMAGSQAIYLRSMLRALALPESVRKYSKKEIIDSLKVLGYILPKDI